MTPTVETVWKDFSATVRQFIRSRVADAAEAEDILQEVFVKIHSGIKRLENPAKLEAWVYLIARNAIIDHYRTRKQSVELPESLPAEAQPDDPELQGLKAAFRRMIGNLPEPYRAAIVLTELEGLTQKELAERAGISLSGAKSRVQRGREQLKDMLHDCCRFEFDARGRVMDCEPRSDEGCPECK